MDDALLSRVGLAGIIAFSLQTALKVREGSGTRPQTIAAKPDLIRLSVSDLG